jgi:hypothetical protein
VVTGLHEAPSTYGSQEGVAVGSGVEVISSSQSHLVIVTSQSGPEQTDVGVGWQSPSSGLQLGVSVGTEGGSVVVPGG